MLKDITSLADISVPESGTVELVRGEDTLRIPIKAISQKDMDKILSLYSTPAAPIQPQKVDGRTIKMIPNEGDAAYLEAVKKLESKQTHAVLLAGLDIDIPGETPDDQWDVISERFSLGEMVAVIGAIMSLSSIDEDAIDEVKNSLRRTPA